MRPTPDLDVAARILEGLRIEGILADPTLERIRQRLADGTMTADDWLREIERDLAEVAPQSEDDALH